MKKNKKIRSDLLGYGLIIFIILVLISIIICLFGEIFKFLVCEYNSLKSLIVFFILVMIIGFPMELLAKGFPKALLELERINSKTAKLMYFVLDTIASVLCMALVDYLITTVSISDITILILSVTLSLLTNSDLKKEIN